MSEYDSFGVSSFIVNHFRSKIEEMKKELDHLRKVCDSKADLEKKQTGNKKFIFTTIYA